MRLSNPLAKGRRSDVSVGQGGGPIWRTLVTVGLGLLGAYLISNVVMDTSKRNVEVLAGIIFLGFVLIAHPFKALLFTIAVLFFPASTTVGTTSTLLIFAVGGLVMMKSRLLHLSSPFVNKTADLAITGFLLTMLLSLYAQDFSSPKAVSKMLTGFVSAIVLYYIVIQLVDTRQRFFRVVRLFEVMSILMGILAILQYLFPTRHFLPQFFAFSKDIATLDQIREGDVRASATFSGFEIFAEFCVISIVFQYFLLRRAKSVNGKLFWLVGIVIMLLALFGTGTRAGIIVLVFGAVYAIITSGLAIPRKDLLRVVFVGLAFFYLMLPFIGGYTSMMLQRLSKLGANDSSVHSREVVMKQALEGIPNSPLIGHGIYTPEGTFRGGVSQNIHSLYVSLAYKMGIPNLIMFLWLASILFRVSWRRSQDRSVPPDLREFMFALNVILVIFLLDEVKIEFVRSAQSMHVSFYYFGLIMALDQIIMRARHEEFSSARRFP
jgi:O-antigen ligase